MEDIDNNEEIYYKWKAERQQRLRLAMAIVPAIVGIVAILFVTLTADYLEMPFPISRTLITALGPVSLLFSGVAVLMIYLQTGFKSKTSSEIDYVKYESELRNLKNRIEHSTSLSTGDVDKIEEKLESLQNKIDQNSYISEAITSEHKEELVGILKADILKISRQHLIQLR
jgi:hypothetical protein